MSRVCFVTSSPSYTCPFYSQLELNRPKKAADLIAAGARTLEDLRRNPKYLEMVSHASKVAIMYGGLDTLIMRSETEAVEVSSISLHKSFLTFAVYRTS